MKVKLFEQDTPLLRTVHFLSGSGGRRDLRGGGGGVMKKCGFKGGGGKKNIVGLKGGSPKQFLKFCRDSTCNNLSNPPECRKPTFLTFRKFKFSRGSILSDALLYYAQKAILSP